MPWKKLEKIYKKLIERIALYCILECSERKLCPIDSNLFSIFKDCNSDKCGFYPFRPWAKPRQKVHPNQLKLLEVECLL